MFNPNITTIMKLTKKTLQLICELERQIGEECYNPNSFDGWTLEEGCSYRYPVTYKDKEGVEHKTSYLMKNIDKTSIDTIRYKFGSNNLFIGHGIINVLHYLEDKYGLDVDELVKNDKTDKPEKKDELKPIPVKLVKFK